MLDLPVNPSHSYGSKSESALPPTQAHSRPLEAVKPPSVGKVANTIVNAVMLDGVEADVARLKRVNEFVGQVPKARKREFTYKTIPFVFISPSQDIGKIANRLSSKVPRLVRYLLKGLGPLEDASELISYLLFEPAFTKELVELGYQDGLKAKSQILKMG
jgi:NTE family protein